MTDDSILTSCSLSKCQNYNSNKVRLFMGLQLDLLFPVFAAAFFDCNLTPWKSKIDTPRERGSTVEQAGVFRGLSFQSITLIDVSS